MSAPSSSTRPTVGFITPATMSKRLVLPAPFGPMIPSASPLASERLSLSATTTAPKLLPRFSTSRIGAIPTDDQTSARSLPPTGMFGAVAFSQMTRSKPLAVFVHCPPTNGVFETFFTGPFAQLTGPTIVFRSVATIAARIAFGILQVLSPLQHVERDLEQPMVEADRLRPWLAGRRGIGVAQFLCALAGQARLEGMTWAPPDFRAQPVAPIAQRRHRRGEQQRLADGHDFRLEALLRRLRPEGREVGRDHHTGHDLDIGLLERRDLGAEVGRKRLIAAGIEQVEAAGLRAVSGSRGSDRPRRCRRRRWGTGRRRSCWSGPSSTAS